MISDELIEPITVLFAQVIDKEIETSKHVGFLRELTEMIVPHLTFDQISQIAPWAASKSSHPRFAKKILGVALSGIKTVDGPTWNFPQSD